MKIIGKIKYYKEIIRPWQWYKNLVIFFALFFVGELFVFSLLEKVFLGFISLCLISSANYVLNDIIDKEKDKLHPEKKKRPLADGKITLKEAWTVFFLLIVSGLIIAYFIDLFFFISLLALFFVTLLYSLFFKNEPILDIIIIAINFVIRAISGALIIKVFISPWLILCPFFLALFLAAGKRDSDMRFLKSYEHKKVLEEYNKEILDGILIISATILIIAYSLYALSRNSVLLITVPIATYLILRYYMLITKGSNIARNPEKIIYDKQTIIGIILFLILLIIIFYSKEILIYFK